MTAYAAHRIRKFTVPANLIEEVDTMPPVQPPCPKGKLRLHVTSNRPAQPTPGSPMGRGMALARTPSTAGGVTRPGGSVAPNNEGGVASPLQPRLGSPAPSVLSTTTPATAGAGPTRPPVQLHVVNQSGSVHTVSVPPVQPTQATENPPRDGLVDKLNTLPDGRVNSLTTQQALSTTNPVDGTSGT